jgi:integrase
MTAATLPVNPQSRLPGAEDGARVLCRCGVHPEEPDAPHEGASVEPTKERVLSVAEVKEILKEAQGTRWYAAFWLLGLTGMRISELLGLEWKNVDLATGILEQTGRFYGQPGVKLLPLKTRAAERNVLIPPLPARFSDGSRTCSGWSASAPGGRSLGRARHGLLRADGQTVLSQRARERIPADQRPSERRRCNASYLPSHRHHHYPGAALSLKAAQSLMGHATDRTTHRVYSHLGATGLAGVAEVVQGLFGDVDLAPPAALLTAEVTSGVRLGSFRATAKIGVPTPKVTPHVPIAQNDSGL